jgi:SAM-dependent methyltransferase
MQSSTKEWFGKWFDSPYYHILYKHRDHEEAQTFIDELVRFLKIKKEDKILDLACGKGRHSIYLNQKGYDVTGLDLSVQNIEYANRFGNERLKFYVHDMRETFANDQFDYILNMFTSFGYFDTEKENEKVVCAAAKALKNNGKLLIDFLNPYTVVHNLVPCEEKVISNISFRINRFLSGDGYIIKDIRFEDKGNEYRFQEKVKAIRRTEFLRYFDKANLKLVQTFGDYRLEPYVAEQSERMIFLLQKEE